MEWIRRLNERHEALKNYVHTAFRYPLPTWGRHAMGFVYFTIPIIGGYNVMQWAISKSHESIGERGEKLEIKSVTGLGDKRIVDGKEETIGSGGYGGGVRLAVSDEKFQRQNKVMLEAFLKSEERKLRKRERQEKKKQKKEVAVPGNETATQ
mmetsp:Transcript_6391/g.9739  ORF Transcript_6391/g.9739 Transcript_6391/m.9739 type:complete len:152 (+) Transcript_6391:152-607(+)